MGLAARASFLLNSSSKAWRRICCGGDSFLAVAKEKTTEFRKQTGLVPLGLQNSSIGSCLPFPPGTGNAAIRFATPETADSGSECYAAAVAGRAVDQGEWVNSFPSANSTGASRFICPSTPTASNRHPASGNGSNPLSRCFRIGNGVQYLITTISDLALGLPARLAPEYQTATPSAAVRSTRWFSTTRCLTQSRIRVRRVSGRMARISD